MPTKIETPADPVCTRCGGKLYGTQAEHDADHEGAERILALAEGAQPDQWLMGAESRNHQDYRAEEFEFLPLASFQRKTGLDFSGRRGEQSCGHQLYYARGGYWPRNEVLKVLSADEALQAGLMPWSSLLTRVDDRATYWPPVAEAIGRLPNKEVREILLGRPIPEALAARNDSTAIIKPHSSQSWLRNGSMPVKGWVEESGGHLHMRAYDALDTLDKASQLDDCRPDKTAIFRAFDLVRPDDVRVVILGQDPYPAPGDAMGLAFSSNAHKLPASLRNIYQEMAADLGVTPPTSGDLTHWAYQGVLLANTSLTLGANGKSHFNVWRSFTETWIRALAARRSVVWILWGNHARQWGSLIETTSRPFQRQQVIIESAHPSPLSARRGFFGSKPFSQANAGLLGLGMPKIHWGD